MCVGWAKSAMPSIPPKYCSAANRRDAPQPDISSANPACTKWQLPCDAIALFLKCWPSIAEIDRYSFCGFSPPGDAACEAKRSPTTLWKADEDCICPFICDCDSWNLRPISWCARRTFGPNLSCSARSQRQFHCLDADLGTGACSSTGCCLSRAGVGACLRSATVLAQIWFELGHAAGRN